MGQLRYKDPTTLAWIDIPTTGPRGVQGQDGVDGAIGPEGPVGPMTDEVWVGPDAPTDPDTVLWFDTDDMRLLGPYQLPPGGTAGSPLIKTTDVDGDISWDDVEVIMADGRNTMHNGATLKFPNQADVAKILLYSTTFGFGITSGSLDIFASSTIRFKQNSITGTEWGYVNDAGFYHKNSKLTAQIHQESGFRGPWDGANNAIKSMTLTRGGSYLWYIQASGMSTTVGLRDIKLYVNGTHEASCNMWINQVNVHTSFVGAFGTGSYAAGAVSLQIYNGGSVSSDVNDFASVLAIPY